MYCKNIGYSIQCVPIVCDISQLTTILTTLYPLGCYDNHQPSYTGMSDIIGRAARFALV